MLFLFIIVLNKIFFYIKYVYMKTKHSLMKKIITWMTHDFFIMVVPESLICLD